jgi:hypothetical protein
MIEDHREDRRQLVLFQAGQLFPNARLIAKQLKGDITVNVTLVVKEGIDIGYVAVMGADLIEQIGKVRLQFFVYKRIFSDLHRCQIK